MYLESIIDSIKKNCTNSPFLKKYNTPLSKIKSNQKNLSHLPLISSIWYGIHKNYKSLFIKACKYQGFDKIQEVKP